MSTQGRALSEQQLDLSTGTSTPIWFTQVTEQYGQAVFQVCTVWNTVTVTDLIIYPRQQPHATHYYAAHHLHAYDLALTAWIDQTIRPLSVWLVSWCPEHHGPTFRLYAPEGANCFYVEQIGSQVEITFTNKPEPTAS